MHKFWYAVFFATTTHGMLTSALSVEVNQQQGSPRVPLEVFEPINEQLGDFRNKQIDQAYNTTLSKEFQDSTSLEKFKEFVQSYPILSKHAEVEVQTPTKQGDKVELRVVLNPDTDAVPVDYLLVNEEGQWKVWNIIVTPQYRGISESLIKNLATIKQPVQEQLQAFKDQDIAKAYYNFSSKEFQKTTSIDAFRKFVSEYPILTQFNTFDLSEPTFSKATGSVKATLYGTNVTAILQYALGIENEEWKIWSLQVVKQSGTAEPPKTLPVPPQIIITQEPPSVNGLPMEFTKMEIGIHVNDRGEIIDPSNILQIGKGEIYVNLFLSHGKKGVTIDMLIEHTESHTRIPKISTTLQQDGSAMLSFVFASPTLGWPKGSYQIKVVSSDGQEKTYPFNVTP